MTKPAIGVRNVCSRFTGKQAHTYTYMRCIHAHVISVHLLSDLCPIWLKRCRRCLWPRMLLTWITLVPISEKNCTEFQQHISAFFELIVRPTSKSCFHIFLFLTGVYHSIHTAWAGLGFPWSLRKGRHKSGSLNSKNLAHLVPKGPEAQGLQYWRSFPLFCDSMSIKI